MKNNKKLPNFLIVGAAKAGTTSLYYYLKEHPEIYMSPIKEPKFITSNFLKFPFKGRGDELIERNIVKIWEEYCSLFRKVNDEKAIGEASADNLYYYEQSIHYIKKFLGDVKIIIILRNPIERAFSAYMHLVRDNREFLTLEEALDQEENRKRQNWEFIWYYKDVGFYYNQVKAYLESYSKVKIYLFDDLKRNPLDLVQDIYRFLEVDDLFVPSNIGEKFNISGVPKNKLINEFLTRPNPLKSAIKPLVKLFLSEHNIQRLYNELLQRNLKKPQMKPKTREYLKNLYKKDILKLQDLINRDLTHWLSS
ncbi:MAG TPA: sulfotransferase [Candidatus Desulfofervidus auxilii]|nr:sulfotransferase [Candidatus Desulfofervidus auxilii]